ncbi:hypothetical protein E2562_015534 [Oryza meyeriana var. granulata]|uniref:tryptophan synthase n=1 Tax=Oryza meyeriana var. granulata TaxID=110450 RepID=A0A6G1CR56_9ORYZ|nr:hypothetical protein E2562_015534 [Oryza meyeriana var. granulata]
MEIPRLQPPLPSSATTAAALVCNRRRAPSATNLRIYLFPGHVKFYEENDAVAALASGARANVSGKVQSLLQDIKQVTDKAVVAGFGISTPMKQIAGWGADGVIIGSAKVRQLGEAASPEEGLKKLEELAKSLKAALP